MSYLLWKLFLDDDVDSFRQLLDEATITHRPGAQRVASAGQNAFNVISLGDPVPPRSAIHLARTDVKSPNTLKPSRRGFGEFTLSRTDLNRRDGKGLTILHYAASSTTENARSFALALISHPFIDLYVQDFENGWTALHRAFYFGNITIGRAILEREAHDKIGEGTSGPNIHATSLIKVKDREGNGPYDILIATIKDRTLHHQHSDLRAFSHRLAVDEEDEAYVEAALQDDGEGNGRKVLVQPSVDLSGDRIFTFGSNKNSTLGLGNQDDRQFPERVVLRRPDHLYKRFYREYLEQQALKVTESSPAYAEKLRSRLRQSGDISLLPFVIRSIPVTIQEVQMSKYHTAVLTNDPVSNLYMCGHGVGGRLGTGNEKTQFNFVCIEDFGSSHRKIVEVALGQDHSLAVTDQGEIFTWGSNVFGQLGTGLSKASVPSEEPQQLVPKQLFGTLKREVIVGVAASRIHSVAHTSTALYTFGKNEGQLGIVDAQAGTLKIQPTPRRVAASRFSCAIRSVSAIDRATVCLLENHEVHVFANYGIVKLQFPLDGFSNNFLKKSFLATRYDDRPNTIVKVACGGDTICALSSAGEIFAVIVDQRLDPGSSSTTSTTNPSKIRDALSTPTRIWSLKKGHMSATDVGVDHDGSVVLTTEAGSVWRKVRRTVLPLKGFSSSTDRKTKEFKVSRVPALTRAIAVRASASGAYSAIRQDCDVTKNQISIDAQTLWSDVFALLPFKNIVAEGDSIGADSVPQPSSRPEALRRVICRVAHAEDLETDISCVLSEKPNENARNFDIMLGTTTSELRIPAHAFLLASRSRFIRDVIVGFRTRGVCSNELFSFSSDHEDKPLLLFKSIDILALVEFVVYVYSDAFVGFWLRSKYAPHLVYRYRQVRLDVMKIATRLELRNLESAVRRMSHGVYPSLDKDFEIALGDLSFFQDGDAMVQLQDAEISVHTDMMSRRCPFFEGLFQGRAAGVWLADRRDPLSDSTDIVRVDLTHVDFRTFHLVLRHIYADTDEELFDDVGAKNADEFLDLVLDVLSVANELMLDRLSQICQKVLGRYVTIRNVCQLLNAVAPCSVEEFKNSALEFLCLNLESMLFNHFLDELDEDLLYELDEVVRANQLNSLPFAKSGRADLLLFEKYPELVEKIEQERRAKLDGLKHQAKVTDLSVSSGSSVNNMDAESFSVTPARSRRRPSASRSSPYPTTPAREPKAFVTSADLSLVTEPLVSPESPSAVKSTRVTPSPGIKASIAGDASMFSSQPTSESIGPQHPDQISLGMPGLGSEHSMKEPMAWTTSHFDSAKLSMKEIMDQATTSRTSNISLGLASQGEAAERVSGTFNFRASQKQRRRQQQHRRESDSFVEAQLSSGAATSPPPSSPWRTVSSSSKLPSTQTTPPSNKPPSSGPGPQRSGSTPQLTMRQTIANKPSAPSEKETSLTSPPQTPNLQRASPSSQASKQGHLSPPTTASKPREIQSIRHIPKPVPDLSSPSRGSQSMADILSQQEAEKNIVKEAAVKRSLQEIQQEQEFQEWWDQESKKVMEQQQAAAASKAGGSRGRGGGGAGGRRGGHKPRRGKGKEKSASAETAG